MLDWLTRFDHALFFFFNEKAGVPVVQEVAVTLSDIGRYPVLLVTLIVLALEGWPRFRRHVLALALIMPVAFAVNNGMKDASARFRPMRYYETAIKAGQVHIHGGWIARKSFPSGHSTLAFFAMGYLALARRRLVLPALALAALIAWSRVATGAHFPSDCLAGALLGSFWAYTAWRVHHYLESHPWIYGKATPRASGPISGSC